jgi:hypothetical protein
MKLKIATQQHWSTAHHRSMGRRRRPGNSTPQKNNSLEDLVGNEKNE